MAVYKAYFDASGHPDSTPTLFVSGFVSSEKQWVKFEREWLALLAGYGIENPFHMTEFAAGRGQYSSWFSDKQRRSAFYKEATHLINRRTNKDFSQGIVLEDFRRMYREYEIPADDDIAETVKKPLSYCGIGAYAQLKL